MFGFCIRSSHSSSSRTVSISASSFCPPFSVPSSSSVFYPLQCFLFHPGIRVLFHPLLIVLFLSYDVSAFLYHPLLCLLIFCCNDVWNWNLLWPQLCDLRSMVEASSLTKSIEAKSLAEIYQLEIPLKTEEDFTDLETLLENDR